MRSSRVSPGRGPLNRKIPMRSFPRPAPRRASIGVLAVALLTALSALGPLSAAAAPSVSPSPSPTASPSPATPATPAPTLSETASPTPAATPAPTLSETASPTPAATASATPTDTASPTPTDTPTPAAARYRGITAVRAEHRPVLPRLARQAVGDPRLRGLTAQGSPAVQAEALADPRFEVFAFSECAAPDKPGRVNLAATPRQAGFAAEVTYRLTLDGRLVSEGPLDLDSEEGVNVEGLAPGNYVLTTYVDGASEPSTEAEVSVARCLVPEVDCSGITFRNPVGNRSIALLYGPTAAAPGDDSEPDGALVLAPGTSRTVRVAYDELDWVAVSGGGLTGDEDEDSPIALVGFGTLTVAQDCGGNEATTGQVGCARGSGTARLDLDVEFGAQESFSYVITDKSGDQVAERTVAAAQGSSQQFTERLPGSGTYPYRLTFDEAQLPYEVLELRVLDCLDVTVNCRSVTVTNPAGNLEVQVSYGQPRDDRPVDTVELEPGEKLRLDWTHAGFRWVAEAVESPGISASAGRGELTVPRDCAAAGDDGARPPVATVTRPRDLADTGSPAGLLGALGAGLLLAAAGSLLLVRRARRP